MYIFNLLESKLLNLSRSSLFFKIKESILSILKGLFSLPNVLIFLIKSSRFSSPILNSIFISLLILHFSILSLIIFIFLILSSILIQLFIIELKLLFSFQSLSINFPFSNDNFILFGNFSLSFIMLSLPYKSLNLFSTSNNNSSSLSFKAVLIFVKIF